MNATPNTGPYLNESIYIISDNAYSIMWLWLLRSWKSEKWG
jgi:hypothetical protein